MPDKPVIFISYRRRDTSGHGRALHDYLSGRFGENCIFFDRSTVKSSDVFPDTLRQGVERCAVLLALIGPEWLDVRGDDGSRRLDDEDDFVRREIALALELGKKVIPVLFDDTPVPSRDRLPDPLKALASRDALWLRGRTHEYRTQRQELVRLLAQVPGVPPPRPESIGERIHTLATYPVSFLEDLFALVTGPKRFVAEHHEDKTLTTARALGFLAALSLIRWLLIHWLMPFAAVTGIALVNMVPIVFVEMAIYVILMFWGWKIAGGCATLREYFPVYLYYLAIYGFIETFRTSLTVGFAKLIGPNEFFEAMKKAIQDGCWIVFFFREFINSDHLLLIGVYWLGKIPTFIWFVAGWGAYRAFDHDNRVSPWHSWIAPFVCFVSILLAHSVFNRMIHTQVILQSCYENKVVEP